MNKISEKILAGNSMNYCKNTILSGLFVFGCLTLSTAQALSPTPPPQVSSTDSMGVNVLSGFPQFTLKDLGIGAGVSSLSHTITNGNLPYFWGFNDDFDVFVTLAGGQFNDSFLVVVGHETQQFDYILDPSTNNGYGYAPHNGDGSTLSAERTQSNGVTETLTYIYTTKDGAVITIPYIVDVGKSVYKAALTRTILYPNGYKITISDTAGCRNVVTNTGLQLKYVCDHANDAPSNSMPAPSVSSIIAVNNAVDYCDPNSNPCTFTKEWPKVNYEWPKYSDIHLRGGQGDFKITDSEGGVTIYTQVPYTLGALSGQTTFSPRVISVKNRTSNTARTTYKYDNLVVNYADLSTMTMVFNELMHGVVAEVNRDGIKCTYGYHPLEESKVGYSYGWSDCPKGRHIASLAYGFYKDPTRSYLPRPVTSLDAVVTPDGVSVQYKPYYTPYAYHANQTLARATFSTNSVFEPCLSYTPAELLNLPVNPVQKSNLPCKATVQGKSFLYLYDWRGNLTSQFQFAVTGTPEAATSKNPTAQFAACTPDNQKWCNKPQWTKDAKGNQTDYTYYDKHGQIKSITLPADKDGVRAQTRYKYSELRAWYKNSSGVVVKDAGAEGIWMLTEENSCSQGAVSGEGCVDASKLVTTRYYYGPEAKPNNLWLQGVEKEADGKVLRTCYQYDIYGHVIAETAPKAGLSSCNRE